MTAGAVGRNPYNFEHFNVSYMMVNQYYPSL